MASRRKPRTASRAVVDRRRIERVRLQLDRLLQSQDALARREEDPVSFVHRFDDPADQEVVGLLAASLAFGNVKTILLSVDRVLSVLGPRPAQALDRLGEGTLRRRLEGFVHRVYRGPDVAHLLAAASRLRREDGSIGAAFERALAVAGNDLRAALTQLAVRLRGDSPSRGLAHLVPDPLRGSACKRLLLYLRWMIRPADGVDLNLWSIDPSVLIIPVDTHVLRISQNLGLTRRRTATWRTAEDITGALRRFDPHDPVKYDFALCHLGISRQCPSRRDTVLCGKCVVRGACLSFAQK